MIICAERIRYQKIDIILDGYHAVIITYLKSVCHCYLLHTKLCWLSAVKAVYCSHIVVLYKYIITILFLHIYHSKFNYQFHFLLYIYILFLQYAGKTSISHSGLGMKKLQSRHRPGLHYDKLPLPEEYSKKTIINPYSTVQLVNPLEMKVAQEPKIYEDVFTKTKPFSSEKKVVGEVKEKDDTLLNCYFATMIALAIISLVFLLFFFYF